MPGCLVDENRFTAVGESHDIRSAETWNDTRHTALWLYNLHYFDDLNAAGAGERREWHRRLIRRWVHENPAGEGVGWNSYPVSRRIINWIKWALREEPPAEFDASLATQARWLSKRLEFHLGANHLLANAKALVFAGSYFRGSEAEGWLNRGVGLLGREINEQVLADGGHYERSPMYHAAVTEDILDSINILRTFGVPVPRDWTETAGHMLRWLAALTHPDGEVAFFNDAAMGIAPRYAELLAYGLRLGVSADSKPDSRVVLAASGYVCGRAGRAWLVCDCAPVGPDHQPGHAHADTLSFELSLGKQRLIVNSGTSIYGRSAERNRQRGTAAHNTVTIDGADSSEVWAGFRVARRARATLLAAVTDGDCLRVEASHDGYRRLRGRNVHTRRWMLDATSLRLVDRVSGTFGRAVAHFHFHPDVEVQRLDAWQMRLMRSGKPAATLDFQGARTVELRTGSWHPRFGESIPNVNLCVEFEARELHTQLTWQAS
jgi:uncharacterized heparinase superfamily protein